MRSAGNVVHADVLSGPDGRSKGCGIVEYASSGDAQRAIRDLNESTLDGRTIFLREDRESGGGDREGSGCTVFVGNLSWDAKWQDLKVSKGYSMPTGNEVTACPCLVLTEPILLEPVPAYSQTTRLNFISPPPPPPPIHFIFY